MAMRINDRIVPNDEEKRIFETLQKAQKMASKPVQLRCAGGWVRDKLLGHDSKDIDIALDTMLGEEFGMLLLPILELEDGVAAKNVVIKSNPEQSKHLETATIRVHDVDIDLVNLRSETYADGSRIPKQAFGTPLQDAMRRDLTINALFYNLDTEQVEDFTGRGLSDLRAGIIRTPLEPRVTFLDDPLRVLRAIRFATRFGFELAAQLQEAAALQEVREALAAKVSRERFGSEIKGCINGPRPVMAIQLMVNLGVFPVVFMAPASARLGHLYGSACLTCMRSAAALMDDWDPQEPLSAAERELVLLSALLLPLRGSAPPTTTSSAKGRSKKSASVSIASEVLRTSVPGLLKNGPSKIDAVYAALPALAEVYRALQVAGEAASSDAVRSQLGGTIQILKADLWRVALVVASLLTMPEAAQLGVDPDRGDSGAESRSPSEDGAKHLDRLACLRSLESAARAFRLDRAWEIKPLLDGRAMGSQFGIKGPLMGVMTRELLRWQMAHPEADVDAAGDWLKGRLAERAAKPIADSDCTNAP